MRQLGPCLVLGKMWDCKTSKMSQSPLAALNAFGLFAADQRHDESHRHGVVTGDGGSPPFRHFHTRYSSQTCRNRLG
jgi:hypothetical protein